MLAAGPWPQPQKGAVVWWLVSLLRHEVLGWSSPHSTSLALGKIWGMCCWGCGPEGDNSGKQLGSAAGQPSASPPPALSPSRGVGDAHALLPEGLVPDPCGGIRAAVRGRREARKDLFTPQPRPSLCPEPGLGQQPRPRGDAQRGAGGVPPRHGHSGGYRQRLCPSCPHLPACRSLAS